LRNYDPGKLAGAFDRIAPFYNSLRPLFTGPYRLAADYALSELGRTGAPLRVLDIGTGTGTLAGAFTDLGADVTGIDVSRGMLRQARKKYGDRINFINASAHGLGHLKDGSFDLVAAGFVLHEMPPDYRLCVLMEMKRLSRGAVLVIDYVPNFNPLIFFVEYMEKSYYRNFLAIINSQLSMVFTKKTNRKLNHFMGLYFCYVINLK